MKDYAQTTLKTLDFGNSKYGSNEYSDGQLPVLISEYFHGNDNPNWRKQVENNEQAGTQVSARREAVESAYAPTIAQYPDGTKCSTTRHAVPVYSPDFTGWNTALVSEAEADALNSLYKNVRNMTSSYDGATFLGELGQTYTMLRDPLKSIRTALLQTKQSFRKGIKRTVRRGKTTVEVGSSSASSSLIKNPLVNGKTAAELLLQWNFGIVPLLNDLQGMITALAQAPLSGRTRVRGYGERVVDSNTFNASYGVAGVIPVSLSTNVRQRVQVVYTAGIGSEIVAPDALGRLMQRGFSISALPAAAYNLIPWSFLLDYFSNVGDMLAGGFTSLSSVKWVVRSEIRTLEVTYVATPAPESKYKLTSQGFASTTVTVRTFNRTLVPVSSLGFTDVYFELPKYGRQYLNMAALARTLFR